MSTKNDTSCKLCLALLISIVFCLAIEAESMVALGVLIGLPLLFECLMGSHSISNKNKKTKKSSQAPFQYSQHYMENLHSMAAEGDHDSQNELAYIYKTGFGAEKNLKKSLELYRKSAKENAEAQDCLASLYYNGEGVNENKKHAIKLWHKSSKQGCSSAKYNLGKIYLSGKEVEKNTKRAIGLWNEAAEEGHTKALNSLAFAFYKGSGVKKNCITAYVNFSVSGMLCDKKSEKKAKNLRKKLTKEEIMKGNFLAHNMYNDIMDKRIKPIVDFERQFLAMQRRLGLK